MADDMPDEAHAIALRIGGMSFESEWHADVSGTGSFFQFEPQKIHVTSSSFSASSPTIKPPPGLQQSCVATDNIDEEVDVMRLRKAASYGEKKNGTFSMINSSLFSTKASEILPYHVTELDELLARSRVASISASCDGEAQSLPLQNGSTFGYNQSECSPHWGYYAHAGPSAFSLPFLQPHDVPVFPNSSAGAYVHDGTAHGQAGSGYASSGVHKLCQLANAEGWKTVQMQVDQSRMYNWYGRYISLHELEEHVARLYFDARERPSATIGSCGATTPPEVEYFQARRLLLRELGVKNWQQQAWQQCRIVCADDTRREYLVPPMAEQEYKRRSDVNTVVSGPRYSRFVRDYGLRETRGIGANTLGDPGIHYPGVCMTSLADGDRLTTWTPLTDKADTVIGIQPLYERVQGETLEVAQTNKRKWEKYKEKWRTGLAPLPTEELQDFLVTTIKEKSALVSTFLNIDYDADAPGGAEMESDHDDDPLGANLLNQQLKIEQKRTKQAQSIAKEISYGLGIYSLDTKDQRFDWDLPLLKWQVSDIDVGLRWLDGKNEGVIGEEVKRITLEHEHRQDLITAIQDMNRDKAKKSALYRRVAEAKEQRKRKKKKPT